MPAPNRMNHSSEAQEPVRSINAAVEKLGSRIAADVLRPILAFHLSYLPLVMIYFAYGATGLSTSVATCGSRKDWH